MANRKSDVVTSLADKLLAAGVLTPEDLAASAQREADAARERERQAHNEKMRREADRYYREKNREDGIGVSEEQKRHEFWMATAQKRLQDEEEERRAAVERFPKRAQKQ